MYATEKNISNAFNHCFTSIGQDMADSLPDVPGFEDHMKDLNIHTMWLRPLKEEEVGETSNRK